MVSKLSLLLTLFMSFLGEKLVLSSTFYRNASDSRIIGGKEVSPKYSFKHQASFQSKSGHICGGAILNELSILTAAHCFDGVYPLNTWVKAGIHSLSEFGAKKHEIFSFIRHEEFNYENAGNDIGIIILKSPLKFDNKIGKVELFDSGDEKSGPASFTGWGATSFPNVDENSKKLQVLEGDTVDSSECGQIYKELNLDWAITSNQLCFGGNGKGFCGGDAGGPLICEDKLCGIASWGFECGIDKFPGVFTRVQSYVDWIQKNIESP